MKRRNTPAKSRILNLLNEAGTALSQEMIELTVKGEMDRVTIYRVLNSFCEDGITHKVQADDGKYYYALCHSCGDHDHEHDHNHFHFKCLGCGKVECLNEQVSVKLPEGYVQKSIASWVSGYCNGCA